MVNTLEYVFGFFKNIYLMLPFSIQAMFIMAFVIIAVVAVIKLIV